MDIIPPATADPVLNAATATVLVFVQDRDSEGVIRQCLSDLSVVQSEFKSGGIKGAIAELASRPSPRLLIVDVGGADDAISRIRDLANVCDPSTGVIVIGDQKDIPFYRALKASGVVEYFFKPLVRTLITQACNDVITGSTGQTTAKSGKLIMVISVRGGAGATTIAVSTAWFLAETLKRRVTLLDLDLQFGDAALQLGVNPAHALQDALEHPDRVDDLFLDRGIGRVDERLGVFAALEALDDTVVPDEAAVLPLLEHLLRRSRYVLVDIPARTAPRLMGMLHLPCTILLVSSGSLVCARDIARLRAKIGPNSAERETLHVLNKCGAGDSLSLEEFTRAVGSIPDIVIPFSHDIATASRLGVQGLQKCSSLQRGLAPIFRQLSGEMIAPPRKSWLRSVLGQQ